MPIALLIEMIQAIVTLAPDIPQIVTLGESAIGIAQAGTVTPEQEANIRAQLDAIKSQIDTSV